MAKLLYCNNGEIEFSHRTLRNLREMPDPWTIFLQGAPANPGGIDREFDALVVTESAAHMIEFKYRRNPISIRSENAWFCEGERIVSGGRRESPQEQVIRTRDALEKWLKRRVPDFSSWIAPWVVLENPNSENEFGGEPFRIDSRIWSRINWIVNGTDRLSDLILEREREDKKLHFRLDSPALVEILTRELAAQSCDSMTVEGVVLTLPDQRPIPQVKVQIQIQELEKLTETDQEGRYAFGSLPIDHFRLRLNLEPGSGLRPVDHGEENPRAGVVSRRIYVAPEGLSQEQVDERIAAIEEAMAAGGLASSKRSPEAQARMREALKWSAIVGGAGGIISSQPIPFADNVILTPMQIALVMHIGRVYGSQIGREVLVKLGLPVAGGFFAQHLTILLYKLVPGAWGLGMITVPAYTILLGYVTALYFERGETPSRSERKSAFKKIRSALRDKELRQKLTELGRELVDEIKARRYRVNPEQVRAMFDILKTRGDEIGRRLSQLLENEDEA